MQNFTFFMIKFEKKPILSKTDGQNKFVALHNNANLC